VHNPHNEYLLQSVQNGLLGLAIFLLWMLYCLRVAWNQSAGCRNILVALIGSYMVCHLFNSFLLDSAEGHLFMIIAGILARLTLDSKGIEKPSGSPSEECIQQPLVTHSNAMGK
jgi:O-antigen ligase